MPDPAPLEQMAERVAERLKTKCGVCYEHPGYVKGAPYRMKRCDNCGGSGFISPWVDGVLEVLSALTPSDTAELAVERGGMVAIDDSRCDEWFDAWPGGEYGDDRCHRRAGHKRNGHWSPKKSTPNPDTPLYRKADEGGTGDAR